MAENSFEDSGVEEGWAMNLRKNGTQDAEGIRMAYPSARQLGQEEGDTGSSEEDYFGCIQSAGETCFGVVVSASYAVRDKSYATRRRMVSWIRYSGPRKRDV